MVDFIIRTSRSLVDKCTDKNVCATRLSQHGSPASSGGSTLIRPHLSPECGQHARVVTYFPNQGQFSIGIGEPGWVHSCTRGDQKLNNVVVTSRPAFGWRIAPSVQRPTQWCPSEVLIFDFHRG